MFSHEHILFVPLLAWVLSVFSKGVILCLKREFSLSRVLGSGGMPSTHSAFVASMTTAIGMKYSIGSDLFMVAFVLSSIIIYDAMNLRFQAGLHAKALNEIRDERQETHTLNESLGHLPAEVLIGTLIGIVTAFALLSL